MEIRNVGVAGCGLMGAGIAQVCAQAGYQTTVLEVNDALLAQGLEKQRRLLSGAVAKGKLSQAEMQAVLERLHGTTRVEDLGACDLVIEAIREDLADKTRLFSRLDELCPPHTIFASNTSSIPIIAMAAATRRPEQVVGLHFFNPVPVMKLVEVIRSIRSSDQAVATATAFAESLGKRPIQSKDRAGFIVNLLLVPYLLDAVRALEIGLASKEDIDTGMVLGCGHPMGPLTLLDFVGLDTTYFICNIMYEEFRDARYAPPTLLKQMVTAGYFGRKSGRGFYTYNDA